MNASNQVLLGSGIILVVLLIVSLLKKEQSEGLKTFLFWSMVFPVAFATIFLAMETVIENQQSVTKGPVHWHADFLIYRCGQQVSLKDPRGLSNKIGTAVLHEHGDERIHVEGTVEKYSDVSLGEFFEVVGGHFEDGHLQIPSNEGMIEMTNGQSCPDGQIANLQVFLYKTENGIVTQSRLDDPASYIMSPESTIPPGDCVIFEFTPETKDRTELMCRFYKIAISKGEVQYNE